MRPDEATDPMASPGIECAGAETPSSLALCGARTRQGGACRHVAMRNGRCRFHGGLSTGPKTAAGLARSQTSTLVHGGRSRDMAEFRRRMRALRADARKLSELA